MKAQPKFKDSSLTEVEVFGLNAELNLADGHSYLDTREYFAEVIQSLGDLWRIAESTSVPQMEERFRSAFAGYFRLPGLQAQERFSISPTASNSIDIVGAWARANGYRVGLVEPTFDNLALLLRRREATVVPVSEEVFFDDSALRAAIKDSRLDCLFVVNPNNPTGTVLGADDIRRLARLCRSLGKVLIIDASFRFCHTQPFDDYQILRDEGVSFIVLEDTGKCWPTLDTKASLLSASADISGQLRTIYEELYLCCSNFSLALIASFMERTAVLGGGEFIHSLIARRRALVESALACTPLRVVPVQGASCMSVVWVDCSRTGLSDLELVRYFSGFGLAVLPGRFFFWDSHESAGHQYIRLALMKPERLFRNAIAALQQSCAALVEAPVRASECLMVN